MSVNAELANLGLPTREAALGFLIEVWNLRKEGRKTTYNAIPLDEAEQRWSRYLIENCDMPEEAVLAEYDKVRAGGPSL